MNSEIETSIRQGTSWVKLPGPIKQILGNSQKEYEKCVLQFSIKNQLRYRGNLVRGVKKDEKAYYEELLKYSRDHLMLYPYHLSDFIVTGMRITPFQYYISIMQDLVEQEKSYDSLPNFTAADCLRLLGIGRNQYIDLMNQSRSTKKFFGVRRRPVREFLPLKPVSGVTIEPWWVVQVGYVTEDDVKVVSTAEKIIIDKIIDHGAQLAGKLDLKEVKGLYLKGLVYLDVPVEDEDCFIVPPLEGFVMNRVLGDYFENLLYQIFVSIDEHTNVAELANVLQTDVQLVKNVISMYCRLGFALKKGVELDDDFHPSWLKNKTLSKSRSKEVDDFMNFMTTDYAGEILEGGNVQTSSISPEIIDLEILSTPTHSKRIGFLFDSTLTAFLMMGNLSPGLKSHAVTMFEVGKLSDESLDSFLIELEKVGDVGEGEAERYFHHALTLRNAILFLRNNPELLCKGISPERNSLNLTLGLGLDLIRCESLQSLQAETCNRLLNKNYSLLVSMAPLTNEIRPVTSSKPPHLGPPIPEVNSVWFKLFLYELTKFGPPSLLLVKGTRLQVLPKVFRNHKRLLVTTWGHDPGNVPVSNALTTLNDALCHSAILIQGQGTGGEVSYIPFPLDENEIDKNSLAKHKAVQIIASSLDLRHSCGYISMLRRSNSVPVLPTTPTVLSGGIPDIGSGLPVNGITDHVSKLLLDSELDRLDEIQDSEVELRVKEGPIVNMVIEKPVDLEKPVFDLENQLFDFEDWTILDCCFGIPLFDSGLNRQVCQRVLKYKLCRDDSLEELTKSGEKLSKMLLEFISKHQVAPIDLGGRNFIFPSHKVIEQEQPLPNQNLLFVNGVLSVWDGF